LLVYASPFGKTENYQTTGKMKWLACVEIGLNHFNSSNLFLYFLEKLIYRVCCGIFHPLPLHDFVSQRPIYPCFFLISNQALKALAQFLAPNCVLSAHGSGVMAKISSAVGNVTVKPTPIFLPLATSCLYSKLVFSSSDKIGAMGLSACIKTNKRKKIADTPQEYR
jgi:hypothetical protein